MGQQMRRPAQPPPRGRRDREKPVPRDQGLRRHHRTPPLRGTGTRPGGKPAERPCRSAHRQQRPSPVSPTTRSPARESRTSLQKCRTEPTLKPASPSPPVSENPPPDPRPQVATERRSTPQFTRRLLFHNPSAEWTLSSLGTIAASIWPHSPDFIQITTKTHFAPFINAPVPIPAQCGPTVRTA